MLKKYLKYSAAAASLLFLLDGFVLSGSPDRISWLILLLAFLYLCHAFFRDRSLSPMGKVVSAVLVPISLLTNSLFFILVVLCAANYPPAKPVEPRLKIVQPPPEEIRAYNDLVTRLADAKGECYSLPDGFSWNENGYDYSFAGIQPLLEERCVAVRKKLLNTLVAGITAKPFVEIDGRLGLSISEPIPNYLPLLNLYRIELLDVARQLDNGHSSEAFRKYLGLWQAASIRLDSRGGMVNSMVNMATVMDLMDLFRVKRVALEPDQIESLLAILDEIPEKLNCTLAGGLLVEYAVIKGSLLEESGKTGTSVLAGRENFLNRAMTARALRWPLFDINLQLDSIDRVFAAAIDCAYLTGEKRSASLDGMEQEMAQTVEHPFSLFNPVGRILNALVMPSFRRYFASQDAAMAKVSALEWLLRSAIGKSPGKLPEALVGEHLEMEKDGQFLKITGDKFSFGVKEISSSRPVQ